jgi:16S rRNA processing protein RimM
MATRRLVVGYVRRAHGVAGEVGVELLTERPERVFAPGRVLRLEREGVEAAEVTVLESRPHRGGLIVRLEGVDSRTAAESLAGCDLLAPVEELAPLEEGEVYYHDLEGLRVVQVDGAEVGRVTNVFEVRPADLLEVELGDGRRVLVPFNRQIVRDVDVERGTITIEPPEGLLEL